MRTSTQSKNPVALNINPEKVGFIILKAREFDAKVEPMEESEPGSNPTDDADSEILEDYQNDPTLEELRGAIDSLDDDEVIDLIALAWVGRGDFDRNGWAEARRLARERHRRHSAEYLVGMPALGDYLEEGLATLGHAVPDQTTSHL
jgi:hypothetical protein